MKKSNLIKLFSILMIGVIAIILNTNNVLAATNFVDITNTYSNTNTSTNTANTNTNSSNTNMSNTNSNRTNNTNLSNTDSTNRSTTNTNMANTNTGSIYNSNNLPQTGIEDSIPIVVLVVVFGISAVYAYKKISDYRNL